jgi:hypothetical protein
MTADSREATEFSDGESIRDRRNSRPFPEVPGPDLFRSHSGLALIFSGKFRRRIRGYNRGGLVQNNWRKVMAKQGLTDKKIAPSYYGNRAGIQMAVT